MKREKGESRDTAGSSIKDGKRSPAPAKAVKRGGVTHRKYGRKWLVDGVMLAETGRIGN